MKNQIKGIITLTLLIIGLALLSQGSYIKLKAHVANWLIASSWAGAEGGAAPTIPWPWADTWVVARLRVPRLGVDQFVMRDSSGESLAFGSGSVVHDAIPASGTSSMIAGHRDTHFRFLSDLSTGDQIDVENYLGQHQTYRVVDTKLFDTRSGSLDLDLDSAGLTLVTCWPFDAMVPGGPLRYLVYALPVEGEQQTVATVQANSFDAI